MAIDTDMTALIDAIKDASHASEPMVPLSYVNDPAHWRRRAEETLTIAESMSDPVSRQILEDVARGYEQLATRAEERLARASLENTT